MDGVLWISQMKSELTDKKCNNLNKLQDHEQQSIHWFQSKRLSWFSLQIEQLQNCLKATQAMNELYEITKIVHAL